MSPGPLRNAYLDVLGIDRWVARDAPDPTEAATAEPTAAVSAFTPRSAQARAPAEQPVHRPPAMPPAPLPAGIEWGPLRERVAVCTLCDLAKSRTQTVFGVGNTQAEWLVIGEAPGAE